MTVTIEKLKRSLIETSSELVQGSQGLTAAVISALAEDPYVLTILSSKLSKRDIEMRDCCNTEARGNVLHLRDCKLFSREWKTGEVFMSHQQLIDAGYIWDGMDGYTAPGVGK